MASARRAGQSWTATLPVATGGIVLVLLYLLLLNWGPLTHWANALLPHH